jgi:hypothetical protein
MLYYTVYISHMHNYKGMMIHGEDKQSDNWSACMQYDIV